MNSSIRPSSVISQQIAEFEAIVPKKFPDDLNSDFAAKLQWNAWQSHLSELRKELEVSIDYEMESSDLQICLSGKPVTGHSVSAGFLAGILANAEKLVRALGEIANSAMFPEGQSIGLMVDGAFESSFGVKMSLASSDKGDCGTQSVETVADQFCGLLNGAANMAAIDEIMLDSSVRNSFVALMKCISQGNGQVSVRTKKFRYGVKMTACDARERIEWFGDYKKRESLVKVSGVLSGGSLHSGRFEIKTENQVYRGPISRAARKQMTGIKLGQEVKAVIKETRNSSTVISEEEAAHSAKHYLESIELAEPNE